MCARVHAPMSGWENKGQQYASGTGRGQVKCITLEVKIQLSQIHYLSSHPLKKGHGFILVCSKMVSQKISF